jgi:putative membrane protein
MIVLASCPPPLHCGILFTKSLLRTIKTNDQMKKIIAITALCSAFLCGAQTNSKDEKFVKCAAEGGLMEVKLAQLALTHASTPRVKELGQAMLTDHMKTNEELKNNAGVYITQLPVEINGKDQRKYDELARKSGTDFDKAYTKLMVKDHKHDLCVFKKEAKKGSEPFKSWAASKVPVLESHLQMSKDACKAARENN